MHMEIALYKALMQAGVQPETAESVVKSVEAEIEKQFNAKMHHLATKSDVVELKASLSDTKAEIIKWYVGAQLGAIGLTIAALKMFLHQ